MVLTGAFTVHLAQHQLIIHPFLSKGDDIITIDTNFTGGVLASVNGEIASFAYGEIEHVSVHPGNGPGNKISILNTNAQVHVHSTAYDRVRVGNENNGLQGIHKGISITNDNGATDDLIVLDVKGPGERRIAIESSGINLGLTSIAVSGCNVTVFGSDSGANEFLVGSTQPGFETHVYGGRGKSDTITVVGTGSPLWIQNVENVTIGNAYASLQDVLSPVTVLPTDSLDLIVNNTGDRTTHDSVTIADSGIRNLAPGLISFAATQLNSLTVYGGDGNNIFDVSVLTSPSNRRLFGGDGIDTLVSTNDTSFFLRDGSFSRTGDAGLSLTSVEQVVLTGGGSANTFYLENWKNAVTMNGGGGDDTFNIVSTLANSSVEINTGGGLNTVNVGSRLNASSSLDLIRGVVSVIDQGNTTLNINDQGSSSPQIYNFFADYFLRDFAPGAVQYNNVARVVLNGGSGGNTIAVAAIHTHSTLSINPGVGVNTVNVGTSLTPSSILDYIGGVVSVYGQGSTTLNLNDQGTIASQVYNFLDAGNSAGYFFRDFATGVVNYDQVANVTLNGGSGGNSVGVYATQVNTVFTLNAGSQTDIVNILGTTGPLTVNTQGGSNLVNVGSAANTLDLIRGPLTINGAGGAINTLNVNDQGTTTARTFDLAATSVTRSGGPAINYDGQFTLNANGGSGGNTWNVTGTSATTIVNIHGGGTDTVNVGDGFAGVQNVLGTVNIENDTSGATINIDDRTNTGVYTAAHMGTVPFGEPGWGYIALLAPADIHYKYADTTSITIHTSSADGDAFGVWENGVPTTVVAHGRTYVYVGDGNVGVDDLLAPLTVQGNGTSTLAINDQRGTGLPATLPADSTIVQHSLSYVVSAQSVSRTAGFGYFTPNGGGGGVSYQEILYQGIAGLELNGSDMGAGFTIAGNVAATTIKGGNGNDTLEIQTTAVGTTTLIDSGRGNDLLKVGKNGLLSGIQGALQLRSATSLSGSDLFLDDSNDLSPTNQAVLTDGSLTGLAPATISWVPSAAGDGGITGVYVLGGRGGNVFTVNNTSLLYHYTYLIPGVGRNQVNVRGMQGNLYVSSVFGGVDDVTIGSQAPALGGTLASVMGDFYLQGGGTSTLVVDDRGTSADRTSTVTAAGVQGLAPAALHWLPGVVKSVALNWGSGNDQIIVQGTAVGVTTTLNGGGGNDAFIRQDLLGSLAPLRLDGGGGVNTLDYSAFLTQVTVNLLTGTATNAQGGIANFANVYGGAGDDELIGNAAANSLRGNAGSDSLFGGDGIDSLYGGAGDDYLDGGKNIDFLFGGEGVDTFKLDSEARMRALEAVLWDFLRTKDKKST